MTKIIETVQNSFFVAATVCDAFFSSNCKNGNPLDAIKAMSSLDVRLERLEKEVVLDNQEAKEIFDKLCLIFEDDDSIDRSDMTFEQCFNVVDEAFDDIQREHPDNEGITRMRVPFDITNQWYKNLSSELQNFCERTVLRRGETPFEMLEYAVFVPVKGAVEAHKKLEKIKVKISALS